MKKFFIFIFFIFVIAIAALFVFVLTFDANRYKDALIEKIERATQKDVEIGNLSLSIFPPVTIKANSISIKDPNKRDFFISLAAGALDVRVRFLPLLRKDLQVEHLIAKDLDILLRDDLKIGVPETILKNISMYGPVNLEAVLSMFGRGSENIRLKGLLYPEVKTKSPYIKNLELRIDLSRSNLGSVLDTLGQEDAAEEFASLQMGGELVISSERLDLDPKKLYDSTIYITLYKGKTDSLPFINKPLEAVDLVAELSKGDVLVKRFEAGIAGGKFFTKGTIGDVMGSQDLNLDVRLKDINIEKFLPDADPDNPGLEGIVNLEMNLKSSGLSEQELLDSLAANGTFKLGKPVLSNINVLITVLEKIPFFSGILLEKLERKLPSQYKELLNQKNTVFKDIVLGFNTSQGKIRFQDILIESDSFAFSADAYVGLNLAYTVSDPVIYIHKEVSKVFIDSVEELGFLKNNQGMLMFPLEDISGKLPDISSRSIAPDLDYILPKLAASAVTSKGQDLLDSIFGREEPAQPEPGSETGPGSGKEPGTDPQVEPSQEKEIRPEEALIRTIFDIISGPKK